MAKPISAGKREMILNGNLVKAILTLAIPVMLNSFIQSMYNLTDTFWLGKIGTTSQAAITLVSPFQNILNGKSYMYNLAWIFSHMCLYMLAVFVRTCQMAWCRRRYI